jgi:N-methylhydantoinase A
MLRIGVDIGGTFTDFAVWRQEEDGYVAIESRKLPSTRPDYAQAVIEGVATIARDHGVTSADPMVIVHGTTVSTNAVIERSQPAIALLVTQGYRDLLTIARLRLDKPIDLFNRRPAPIVPRERTFEVAERLLSDGSVDTPLDEDSVKRAVDAARAAGARGIGICFLHSWQEAGHERRAAEIARAHAPDLEVVASHEVWPQQSEYERAVLTLLNTYVKPLMEGYLGRIETFLRENFPKTQLYITKSNGGVMSAREAQKLPIHTLLSGPAAGVTAARMLGSYLNLDKILTLDMGGTSTDVSLIDQGRALTTGQAEVGDFPLLMPVIAIEAMGAGGGSLIWLDGKVLKVGPRSAGSKPGPACYGVGGEQATLTDAYLIAGLLSERGLLGGKLKLHRHLAEAAMRPIAEALGTDVTEAAEAAIAVATSNMIAKVSPFLARLGVGAADLSLMIFGGAGGLHGPMLADEIGIRRIVVPRIPSVFCAFGGLVSDLVHDGVRSVHGVRLTDGMMGRIFDELTAEGQAWLERQSHSGQVVATERRASAEMRYAAQSFTIAVTPPSGAVSVEALTAGFHDEHERLFGHANRAARTAVDALRLQTVGRQAKPPAGRRGGGLQDGAPVELRDLRIAGGWARGVPVHEWDGLPGGWSAVGPAIIQQDLATIFAPPGYVARLGTLGDLELTKE